MDDMGFAKLDDSEDESKIDDHKVEKGEKEEKEEKENQAKIKSNLPIQV